MRFITLKKEQNNYSKSSVFASYGLLRLFFASKLVVFVDRRRKIIACPRAQGTLAPPLIVVTLSMRFIGRVHYFQCRL